MRPQRTTHGKLLEPLPLPRSRAYLSLIFAALALLLFGGVLSYASGSPDLHGRVSSYWTVFFTFHAVAFGGAALFGAFPRLGQPQVKIAWVSTLAVILAVALGLRWSATGEALAAPGLWSAVRGYAPALVPVICGLLWGSRRGGAEA